MFTHSFTKLGCVERSQHDNKSPSIPSCITHIPTLDHTISKRHLIPDHTESTGHLIPNHIARIGHPILDYIASVRNLIA